MKLLERAYQDEKGFLHATKSAALKSDFNGKAEAMARKWLNNCSYSEKFEKIADKLPEFLTEIAELKQLKDSTVLAMAQEEHQPKDEVNEGLNPIPR